jgi:YfiH family protein
MAMALTFVTPRWNAPPNVRALCTTRAGGVSGGSWASLNLGTHVGDAPAAVEQNRRLLQAAADLPGGPQWLRQMHGVEVADLDALPAGSVPEADAALTTRTGTVCAVLTADCLPVVFAATDGSLVGVAHAGWRGLAGGVLEAAVTAMRSRLAPGVELIHWTGPAISAGHFEVGADVRDAFLSTEPQDEAAFSIGRPARWQCDLPRLARRRLASLGVADGGGGDRCTYEEEDMFYSHRRDVQHRGLATTGRMATLVWRQA